jgi:hypothetical protein
MLMLMKARIEAFVRDGAIDPSQTARATLVSRQPL